MKKFFLNTLLLPLLVAACFSVACFFTPVGIQRLHASYPDIHCHYAGIDIPYAL
jgi:hypothetical protein